LLLRGSDFVEPIVKELPLGYVVEMNRLIQIQMGRLRRLNLWCASLVSLAQIAFARG
jgi:hypothetical protein